MKSFMASQRQLKKMALMLQDIHGRLSSEIAKWFKRKE